MDNTTQNGRKLPSGSTGDVDPNGDVVSSLDDALHRILDVERGKRAKQHADAVIDSRRRRRRLERGVGEFVADNIDRDEHLANIERLIVSQSLHLRHGAARR